MAAATQPEIKTPAGVPAVKAEKGRRYLTWKEFERRYLQREDGYKYEWENGKVEKTHYAMNVQQLYIWKNLNRYFQTLKEASDLKGELTVETDTFLDASIHRRPDIAYFTDDQIVAAIEHPVQVPGFVIEIISPTDNVNKVNKKVRTYFEKGIQVVWHIFPELKEVHVYESATRIRIIRGEELCSAESVIPGFILSANEIFKI